MLLYPSGRLTSDGLEHLGSNGGAWHLLEEAPECRIVLIRTSGLWGSSFSRWGSAGNRKRKEDALETPEFFRAFFAGLRDMLLSGIFFMPRRRVRIEVKEAVRGEDRDTGADRVCLPAHDRLALNRALEAFFNAQAHAPGEGVPPFIPPEETPRHVLFFPRGRK